MTHRLSDCAAFRMAGLSRKPAGKAEHFKQEAA